MLTASNLLKRKAGGGIRTPDILITKRGSPVFSRFYMLNPPSNFLTLISSNNSFVAGCFMVLRSCAAFSVSTQGNAYIDERPACVPTDFRISRHNTEATMKERRGYIAEIKGKDGKVTLYARVTYTDSQGKRKNLKKRVYTRTEGKEWLKKKVREIDDHGTAHLENARATFNNLADYYEKNYLTPPVYVDQRKVSGMRSYKNAQWTLTTLRAHFGKKRIKQIRHGDILAFKTKRLQEPTKRGTQLGIASVNRELALLRAIFAQAVRDGVMIHNPFIGKTRLISVSDERKRERVLSGNEEARLLAVCQGPREHLRPILICALDTGMRKGEMLKLQWKDVDLSRRIIRVQAFNTKTMKERTVAMTGRLVGELRAIIARAAPEPTERIFGISNNVKKAFTTACRLAGITDLRLHDLRHVAATRMIQAGVPREQVGRILGHTQANTTYRYINVSADTIQDVAVRLDEFNRKEKGTETVN